MHIQKNLNFNNRQMYYENETNLFFKKPEFSVALKELPSDSNLSSSVEKPKKSNIDNGKEIGVFSAIFLIVNRMIGTGIFATPSAIYRLSGSIGVSLIMWIVGFLIAVAGLMVYLEWGSAIPKNGGEKNYLTYFYKKPKNLVLSMFAAYTFLLGGCAANSIVFGEYILSAAGQEPNRWNQRGVGFACVSFAFIANSVNIKLG